MWKCRACQHEAIFIEPDLAISVNQNVPIQAINDAIYQRGFGELFRFPAVCENDRTTILTAEGSDSVSAIAGLSVGSQGQVINLFDMSNVYRARQTDPDIMIRFDGTEAFTLGIAGSRRAENIVEVGKRVPMRSFAELDTGRFLLASRSCRFTSSMWWSSRPRTTSL